MPVNWVTGGFGVGYPVIEAYDPGVFDCLLGHAASLLD